MLHEEGDLEPGFLKVGEVSCDRSQGRSRMGVRQDSSCQELLQLSVGRAHHGWLAVRLLEKIPDLLSGRLFRYLGFDRSGAVEGDGTHGLFVVAVPSFGVGRRAGFTNGPPSAGQLQVGTHGDMLSRP